MSFKTETNVSVQQRFIFPMGSDGPQHCTHAPFEDHSKIFQIFKTINCIIFVIGWIGNTFSIAIFMRPSLLKLTVSVLTILLAVADNLNMSVVIAGNWLFSSGYKIDCPSHYWLCCYMQTYADMVFSALSSWTIVSVSLERFVSVYMPFRKAAIFTLKNILTLISAYTLTAIVIFAWVPFVMKFDNFPNGTACSLKNVQLYKVMGTIDILLIYVIPFIILAVLNTMIVCKLRSQKSMMFARYNKTGTGQKPGSSTRCIQSVGQCSGSSVREARARSNDRSVNAMLLSIAICHMICILPFQVNWIYNQVRDVLGREHLPSDEFRFQLTLTVKNLNYVTNFFLYSATSKLFRRELRSIVGLKKPRIANNCNTHTC